MTVKGKRILISLGMLVAIYALITAFVHHSVSGALIAAGGLFAGISLLLNAHLLQNNIQAIPAAAMSAGYDRRGRFYSRAGGVLLIAGIVASFIEH
jgi:hypothetical protein